MDETATARLSASLFIENIFDETYYHPNHLGSSPIQYIQTPRNIRLAAEISL